MALDPLATVADIEARGVNVDASETGAVETFLDVASATVRDAAGSPISEVTATVELEGDMSPWLSIPAQPVTEVTTVEIDGQEITDYRLVSGRLYRRSGWSRSYQPSSVTVTYTAGLPEVPADVVDLVCRLAVTALVEMRSGDAEAFASAGNKRQESLGDYSVTYGADGDVTSMRLPDYQRDRLAARFGGRTATVVKSR